jgi:hypothetical protein
MNRRPAPWCNSILAGEGALPAPAYSAWDSAGRARTTNAPTRALQIGSFSPNSQTVALLVDKSESWSHEIASLPI